MAQFDFFSQPRGPEIDINLYPRAANAGIQAGNSQKTIAESILGGVQEGLQTYGQYQQNEIRQNQIDQQPTENAVREEQLQRMQLENEVAALDVKAVTENEDLYLRTKKAELEKAASTAENQAQDLKNKDEITKTLTSNNDLEIGGIYSNPNYAGTLIRDPAFADSVLGSAAPRLDEQTFTKAYQMLGYSKAQKYALEESKLNANIANQLYTQAAKGDYKLPAAFNSALQGYDPNKPQDIFADSGIEVYPTGLKNKDDQGRLLPGNNIPKPGDPEKPDKAIFPFELFSKGQYLGGISKDDADKYQGAKSNYLYQKNILGRLVYGQGFQGKPGIPPINGIQGPGILEPPAQVSIDTPAPAAQPSGVMSQMSGGTGASGNWGEDSETKSIVNQTRQAFSEIAKNPPPGIKAGTLEQQLAAKTQAIQERVQAIKGPNIPTAVPSITPPPQGVPTTIPTPSEALSNTLKQNVSFNLPYGETLRSPMYERIVSDPLLSGAPPLIKGLAAAESGGRRAATSPTGVKGLLQVTRGTAAEYGLNRDIPEENVLAGQLYLYDNMVRFNGNIQLALAAYNAGPGVISDAVRATQSTRWEDLQGYLKDRLSPGKFKEVSKYPDRVLSLATQFMGSGSSSDLSLAQTLDENNLLLRT